jgi:hypothetical protein
MNYYEPYQRLDAKYYYVKADYAIYIMSSVNVYMPRGTTLTGRDTVPVNSYEATLEYFYAIDQSAVEPYIFKYDRKVKFLDFKPSSDTATDAEIKEAVASAIKRQIEKIGKFTVNCIVYAKSGVGGQVTNTIAQTGEVVII